MLLEETVEQEFERVREAIVARKLSLARRILYQLEYSVREKASHNVMPEFFRLTRKLNRRESWIKRKPLEFLEDAMMLLSTQSAYKARDLTKALREFQTGTVDSEFGISFLANFVKHGVTVPVEELRKYELELDTQLCAADSGTNGFRSVQFKSPYNFCLTYNAELITHVGFYSGEGFMFINQIQGREGALQQLSLFKWPQALVSSIVQFGVQHRIPAVVIQSVYNNDDARLTFRSLMDVKLYPEWVKTFEDATKVGPIAEQRIRDAARSIRKFAGLMPSQGTYLFDVTARKLGFERMQGINYIKLL